MLFTFFMLQYLSRIEFYLCNYYNPKYNLKNNIEVFYMSGYLKGNSIVGEERISSNQ